MASTVGNEQAGSDEFQRGHMGLIFGEGLSFSGYERDNLFLNVKGERFKEISGVSGIDSISDGRAVVPADFDNDGDLDVFVTSIQGQAHSLFHNNIGQDSSFLRLTLQGRASGRDAFGAMVRMKTAHGIQTRIKSGGDGFLAQRDPRLLFGLGKEEAVEWVEIAWPSGAIQRLEGLRAGVSIKVVEGDHGYQVLQEKKLELPDPLSPDQRLWQGLRLVRGSRLPAIGVAPVAAGASAAEFQPQPGKRYFLNLWATWCGPCRKEMPELQKLLPQFQARGIQLIGLSLDQEAGPEEIKSFAAKLGVSYPLLLLEAESLDRIYVRDQAFVPLSILLDEQGRVVEVYSGWSPQTERKIHALLKGN